VKLPKWRQVKFKLIQWLALPIGIVLLKILVRTWRIDPEARRRVAEYARRDRIVLATFHGNTFPLIALSRLAAQYNRRICIMTSPSRDGLVFDRVAKAFNLEVVKGSSRSKAISGARGMIREIESGAVAVLSVDGPRGPVTVPKLGFIGITRSTQSELFVVVMSTDRYIQTKSWDRLFIPLPFAKFKMEMRPFPMPGEEVSDNRIRYLLELEMLEAGRAINCPIVARIPDPRPPEDD
jgi:lysophospholipid acyltransferase (LPLAT)-like uncharacterized protein